MHDRALRRAYELALCAYRRTLERDDFALEVVVFFSRRPFHCLGVDRRLGNARIVVFAVPDIRSHNGTGNGGLPATICGGGYKLGLAVVICDLYFSRERPRTEAVVSEGYTSRPPAGGDLCHEQIFLAAERGNIVFVLKNAVVIIGPSGLVFVMNDISVGSEIAYADTIHEHIENTEGCGANDYRLNTARGVGQENALYGEQTVAAR